MITLLAQNTANQTPLVNLFETVVGLFSRADTLAQPAELVERLGALSVVWAVVFIIVGLMCLLNGYKFYKVATVALALFLGAFAGYWLGQKIEAPFIIAGCMGILMAVTAFPLMKYTVAMFGGLAGAFIGANLWTGFSAAINKASNAGLPVDAYWIGALVGLLLCGMLAFVLFKLSIELFTSVSGATIAVFGAIALLLSFEPWRDSVSRGLTASQLVVPLLVLVPALIGLILQETWTASAGAGEKE